MKYLLAAIDIDGTLSNSNKELSGFTVSTIIKAQKLGLRVVIASGRPTRGLAYYADLLQIYDYGGYVMAYNGGQVTEWATGNILYTKAVTEEGIRKAVELARKTKTTIIAYSDKEILTETPDDEYIPRLSRNNRMPIVGVDDFLQTALSMNPAPVKLLLSCPTENIDERVTIFKKELKNQMDVFRSADTFIELVPKGIDKGYALSVLAKHLNIHPDQIVAFGDESNDISMLRFVGLGVAVINATEPAKAAADLITKSNNEDGVAHVLDTMILNQLEHYDTN